MPSKIIVCPSGLSGEIRNFKFKEARKFANRSALQGGKMWTQALGAIWVETNAPGPYDLIEGHVNWDRILQGDRFYTMLMARMITYPDQPYSFRVPCRACGKPIDWEIDLSELPVFKLPEESAEIFRNGNKFGCELPGAGNTVEHRLIVGEEEAVLQKKIDKAKNEEEAVMIAMNFRINQIGDVEQREREKFLDELDLSDIQFLREEFDRVDCGVDTTFDVVCPRLLCGATQEVELPLDRNFLLPRVRRS